MSQNPTVCSGIVKLLVVDDLKANGEILFRIWVYAEGGKIEIFNNDYRLFHVCTTHGIT